MTTMPIIDALGRVKATAAIPEHVRLTLGILVGRGRAYTNIYDADHALRELWTYVWWGKVNGGAKYESEVRMMIDMLTDALRSNDWWGRLIELIDGERQPNRGQDR